MLGHLAGMLNGGFVEDRIEAQGWKSSAATSLVGGGDEVLFGNREGVEFWHEQKNPCIRGRTFSSMKSGV